jgi:hypothetical protein
MKWFWIWGFWKLVIPVWVCGFVSGVSNVGLLVVLLAWVCGSVVGGVVGGVAGVGVGLLLVVFPAWVRGFDGDAVGVSVWV